MIPSHPKRKAPSFKFAEGGEIRSGKDRFTGPRFHSRTVPFAYSVAIWKSNNPMVANSCEDMSMSFRLGCLTDSCPSLLIDIVMR